ncbi:MAG: helix-turn-helix transcriptional regulator [Ruminococcaceae bacterium]|nr:helix-turn-helix transcriptional regulator [Oscillospiraceae bacterium]
MDIKILECRRFFSATRLSSALRTVKDYEIDIELGEERTVIIDGIEHQIKRGDVCIRKPGQTVYGRGVQHSALLTLDFSGKQTPTRYSRNISGPIQSLCSNDLLTNLNGIIHPFSEYTFLPIYSELLKTAFTDEKAAHNLVMELLHKLNAEVFRQNFIKTRHKQNLCDKVLEYMKNNLSEQISLNKLANMVDLDKNYFVRLFKNTYGKTPINVLIDLRMERASDLISNTDLSVTNISEICGYNSVPYFIAEYKKHFGITPLKQRKNIHHDFDK